MHAAAGDPEPHRNRERRTAERSEKPHQTQGRGEGRREAPARSPGRNQQELRETAGTARERDIRSAGEREHPHPHGREQVAHPGARDPGPEAGTGAGPEGARDDDRGRTRYLREKNRGHRQQDVQAAAGEQQVRADAGRPAGGAGEADRREERADKRPLAQAEADRVAARPQSATGRLGPQELQGLLGGHFQQVQQGTERQRQVPEPTRKSSDFAERTEPGEDSRTGD